MSELLSLLKCILVTRQSNFSGLFGFRKRIFGLLLIVDVDFRKAFARVHESAENVAVVCSLLNIVICSLLNIVVCSLFNIVILSGVNGLARESIHGVERPAVCRRNRFAIGWRLVSTGRKQVPRLRMTVLRTITLRSGRQCIGRTNGRNERNARQLAAQVGGVALAVLGVVQDGVDVVKNVPLGDGGVVVAGAELFERPVR
jgi:hypothetical protein